MTPVKGLACFHLHFSFDMSLSSTVSRQATVVVKKETKRAPVPTIDPQEYPVSRHAHWLTSKLIIDVYTQRNCIACVVCKEPGLHQIDFPGCMPKCHVCNMWAHYDRKCGRFVGFDNRDFTCTTCIGRDPKLAERCKITDLQTESLREAWKSGAIPVGKLSAARSTAHTRRSHQYDDYS